MADLFATSGQYPNETQKGIPAALGSVVGSSILLSYSKDKSLLCAQQRCHSMFLFRLLNRFAALLLFANELVLPMLEPNPMPISPSFHCVENFFPSQYFCTLQQGAKPKVENNIPLTRLPCTNPTREIKAEPHMGTMFWSFNRAKVDLGELKE